MSLSVESYLRGVFWVISEVAQASGGSGREQAIPNEVYPDEGMHDDDDGPKAEENSDSEPDQPAIENTDGSFPKLSARQKKWMELRAKMVLNNENIMFVTFIYLVE